MPKFSRFFSIKHSRPTKSTIFPTNKNFDFFSSKNIFEFFEKSRKNLRFFTIGNHIEKISFFFENFEIFEKSRIFKNFEISVSIYTVGFEDSGKISEMKLCNDNMTLCALDL